MDLEQVLEVCFQAGRCLAIEIDLGRLCLGQL